MRLPVLLFIGAIIVALGLSMFHKAQAVTTFPDPCLDVNTPKSNAIIAATNPTTVLVASSGGSSKIIVCGITFTLTGTSPTFQLKYALLGSACATAPVALTGVMAPLAGSILSAGWGGMIVTVPAANDLCAVLTGTTPSAQGVLTFVQQ